MAATTTTTSSSAIANRSDGGGAVREYDFVRVELTRHREGLELAEDYRELIRGRAAEGWEFVQAIVLEQHVRPHLDLVFRRKPAKRKCKDHPTEKGESQ